MTCEECEQILRNPRHDYIRAKDWLFGLSLWDLAKEHAEQCVVCAGKIADDSKVNSALDQLRLSTMGMEAPATVEKHLVAEFRQRMTARGRSVAGWRLTWATVSALFVVAACVTLYTALRPRPSGTVQTDALAHEAPAQRLSSVRPEAIAVQPVIVHRRLTRRPSSTASNRHTANADKAMQQQIVQPSFLPASEDLTLNGGSNVIRVTLPVSSLAAMGVPVHPDMSNRRVIADVARDPFGAVIAIHLVEMNSSAN
jgi:hypothetical protein